jgi:hypothetical protein
MTRTEITFWALAAIIILSAFAILAAIANPARATDWDWSMSGDSYHSHKQKPRRRKTYTRRSYDSSYDRERVRGYRDMGDINDPVKFCLGPVRGVGTQWVGEEGAMDAAMKDWRERTRYDYGEIFVDMTHAEDFRKRCGRTSIGEVAGAVFFRCEIWARPCKAEFSEGAAPKK